jgi:hypothetical protein
VDGRVHGCGGNECSKEGKIQEIRELEDSYDCFMLKKTVTCYRNRVLYIMSIPFLVLSVSAENHTTYLN